MIPSAAFPSFINNCQSIIVPTILMFTAPSFNIASLATFGALSIHQCPIEGIVAKMDEADWAGIGKFCAILPVAYFLPNPTKPETIWRNVTAFHCQFRSSFILSIPFAIYSIIPFPICPIQIVIIANTISGNN